MNKNLRAIDSDWEFLSLNFFYIEKNEEPIGRKMKILAQKPID